MIRSTAYRAVSYSLRAKWRGSIGKLANSSKPNQTRLKTPVLPTESCAAWAENSIAGNMNPAEFTPVVVTTTSDDRAVLEKISYQLVESGLAACVQISGPITSCYIWDGKVENSDEWSCAIKTSLEKFEKLQDVVLRLHNYDEPQLVAVPVLKGSNGYLQWMRESLK